MCGIDGADYHIWHAPGREKKCCGAHVVVGFGGVEDGEAEGLEDFDVKGVEFGILDVDVLDGVF